MRQGRREMAGADRIPAVAAPGWACNVACMAPTTTETLAALVGFDTPGRNPGSSVSVTVGSPCEGFTRCLAARPAA